jgi:lipopolysaccharide exporter
MSQRNIIGKVKAIEKNPNQHVSESLSKVVVKGGLWVFALRILNRGLGFIRTLILARLLSPKDFGLLGIAMLSISALETFSQTGLQPALVQKKENVESYLDTAWTVSAIRGIILFFLLFWSSPFVASFFSSPRTTLIIRVIAATVLLSGLKNIGVIFFEKELEFNKQFFYQLSGTLANFSVAIVLAFVLRNVWALVWGGLASSFVQFFMSYIVHPYRPKIRFEKTKFAELFRFGKWVGGSGVLVFLITQGDDILVGKMLGATALGFYQIAYLISNFPATEITHVISQVTFPTYSKLKQELPRLRDAYLKVLKHTALISIPMSALIFIFAANFTEIFLGRKWLPMVPAMQILALCGAIRSIGATTGSVFRAIGRPDFESKLHVIRLFVLIIFIYPFTLFWGIWGTALAFLLSTSATHPIADYLVIKTINCNIREFAKILSIPLIATAIMSSILKILRYAIDWNSKEFLFILIILGIILYAGVIRLFSRIVDYDFEIFRLGKLKSERGTTH